VSEPILNSSSASSNYDDCSGFTEVPPKELLLKNWIDMLVEVDD